jgi:hypothetical protein
MRSARAAFAARLFGGARQLTAPGVAGRRRFDSGATDPFLGRSN